MLPQPQQQSKTYFCYLFFYTIYDAIIGLVLVAFTLFLVTYAGVMYHKTEKIRMLSSSVKIIYGAIFAWSIAYIAKLVFGEIIFLNMKLHENDEQPPGEKQYESYSKISKYLFGVDLVGVFILQTILLLVINNWMNNIVAIFSQISQMEDTTEKKARTQNYLKFQVRVKRLLKLYLVVRSFFFLLIIAFFVFTFQDADKIFVDIMLVLLLAEAYFVVSVMILGVISLKRNKKLAELVNEDEIKIMLFKYLVLLICATTRAVVDTVFVFKNFNHLAQKKTCYIEKPGSQNIGLNFANVFFQGLFTHCLPIFFVIRIYKVNSSNVDLTQSLLAAEQYTGSSDNINIKN